jgi:hypothetical protein
MHSFLLRGDNATQYSALGTVLRVEHLLADCTAYSQARQQRFNASVLQEVFNTVSVLNIVD